MERWQQLVEYWKAALNAEVFAVKRFRADSLTEGRLQLLGYFRLESPVNG